MDFGNKVFIISGAYSGIGKACAEALINNGAIVIGMDTKQSSINHDKYIHYLLDVADEELVIAIVNEIDEKFERIDGLANCAGMYATAGI